MATASLIIQVHTSPSGILNIKNPMSSARHIRRISEYLKESKESQKMASLTPLKHDKSTTQNVCLCFSSSSSSSSFSSFSLGSSSSSLLLSCLYSLVIAWLFFRVVGEAPQMHTGLHCTTFPPILHSKMSPNPIEIQSEMTRHEKA